ncbi:MAG: hypothetical protein H6626_06205 [Pseudobdellovibrionaceae bacterium]|nr:hypothetical protein [Bdellovibrionales bacterium]USN48681.1 MAG: hypothetical protein H6626_06205 [Pseudobdellovibrionaceae bacterium]
MKLKHLLVLLAGLSLSATVGCSNDGSGGSSSSSDTYTLSGSLSTPASLLSNRPFAGVGAMDAACANGNLYQVYCVTFEADPQAASGTVGCNGGTSGTYEVAGLPKGTPVGCFVRVSTNGTTYATLGTIELPAAGSLTNQETLVASGNMGVNLTIGSNGKVQAEVTTDSRTSTTPSATDTNINGIYQLTCDVDSTLYDVGFCKCFLGEDYYSGAGYSKQEDCLGDVNGPAAGITDTVAMYIDFNIYNATTTADLPDSGGSTIPAGSTVQAVSIWGAQNSTTSARGSGGEGLSDFATAMGLNFASSVATQSISWTATLDTDNNSSGGTLVNTTFLDSWGSQTVGDWKAWIRTIYLSAVTNEFWTCTENWGSISGNDGEDDAGCLSEFIRQNMDHNNDGVYPRVYLEGYCNYSTGCDATLSKARVWVEGVDFDYANDWNGTSQDAVTADTHTPGPQPSMRFVFEQWHAFPSGGGTFTQRHDNSRWFNCASDSSGDVQHSSCGANWGSSSYDGVQCEVDEELSIKFLPNGTGQFKTVFEQRQVVRHATWHRSTDSGPVSDTDAADVCRAVIQNEATFMATTVKQ